MKIVLANLTKMVDDTGGLAKVTSSFANEMYSRGHDVTVVYSDVQTGDFYYPVKKGIECCDIRHYKGQSIPYPWYLKIKREFFRMFDKQKARTVNNDFAETYLLKNLKEIITTIGPEIIVSFQPATSKMLLLDLGLDIPVITMSHGDPEDYFHFYPEKEIPALEKSAVNQVLLPSFATHITNHLPNAKTIVIGNAVPQSDTTVNLLRKKETYTILFVGRLSKNHKRPHLLIEAFGKIAGEYPQWNVELWGAEDGKAYYQQLKEKIRSMGLENRVALKGATKKVTEQLLRGDIFVMPSAYEGFGLSMAEAMSVGLPVIGYKNTPAINELIIDGKNGFLCDEGTDDLADKLKILMDDKELRSQLGTQAKVDMERFAPEIIWNQWEELLYSLTKGQH